MMSTNAIVDEDNDDCTADTDVNQAMLLLADVIMYCTILWCGVFVAL